MNRWLITMVLLLLALSGFALRGGHADEAKSGLIVHEWGVVKSGNGQFWIGSGNGLPDFVHQVDPDGLQKKSDTNPRGEWEGGMDEPDKPIIYFYSDKELTLDCSVKLPKTPAVAWWPTCQVDSSRLNELVRLKRQLDDVNKYIDDCQKSGIYDENYYNRVQEQQQISQKVNELQRGVDSLNLLKWSNVKISPKSSSTLLPVDSSSWFTQARDVDACALEVGKDREKFLFYEGRGMLDDLDRLTREGDRFTLKNSGTHSLRDLYFVHTMNDKVFLEYVEVLESGQSKTFEPKPLYKKTDRKYREAGVLHLEEKLKSAGLYEKEAKSIMKIWSKDFFAKEGSRVIYRVDQELYDKWLPLELSVKPAELKRVLLVCNECSEETKK